MIQRNRFPRLGFVLLLGLAAALGACDMPGETSDHPVGVAFLRADGSEAARFTYDRATVSGQLVVPRNQSVTYRIRLVDGNGNLLPVDGVEYSVRDVGAVIAFAVETRIQGADELVLTGRSAVSTTLFLDVWHGRHLEFAAAGIPVIVP
jgi:hypothetical protein